MQIMIRCFPLPLLPEEFLEVTLTENTHDTQLEDNYYPAVPSADSEIFSVSNILNAKRLTDGDPVKETFLIELPSYGRLYEPGDTIGILPHNRDEDLMQLFEHLKITHLVHKSCKITQNKDVELKPKPSFIDKTTTLYEVFRNHLDINCIPKRTLVRLLAEHTRNTDERKMLELLCSFEGSKKYGDEILAKNRSFLNLISTFPSCQPPVARLLENLPMLLPRWYSIASSPLSSPDTLKIVFTVVETMKDFAFQEGLCTGMLKSIINKRTEIASENSCINMFYRKPGIFRLPNNNDCPLIFIGAGSGIAPYIGFLEHRKALKLNGVIWLFYGCRYKNYDYLFKDELEEYLKSGVLTKLLVSFSREFNGDAKYVQDNLKKFRKEICDMIFDKNAVVYLCGYVRGVRKSVLNTFIEMIQEYKGLNWIESKKLLMNLETQKRYLQDVWN